MGRGIPVLLACAVVLGVLVRPAAGDESEVEAAKRVREEQLKAARTAIAAGMVEILKMQEEGGEFVLNKGQWRKDYPVGSTALAVLALQHAMPYLDDKLAKAADRGLRKGLSFIKKSPIEPRTYSAGAVICALYKDDPTKNLKLIRRYANGLIAAQHSVDPVSGMWGYIVQRSRGKGYADNSNTQFAILGLYYAALAGVDVPATVWKRTGRHYQDTQLADGGWGYRNQDDDDGSTASMTLTGTIGLHICQEMVYVENPQECKPPPPLDGVDRGLTWITRNLADGCCSNGYCLYAMERLGTLMGRSNIGPHDWYAANVAAFNPASVKNWGMGSRGGQDPGICFLVLFLSRGLDPIIINKLQRKGTDDWNNTPYDVKHLVEDIAVRYQLPCQWRIVTLEAPLGLLLRTPILHISGHEALSFTDEEKAKLKAYVEGGGTILAQACCGRKEFDESFRKLVKELFGDDLRPLPEKHRIYELMDLPRKAKKPKIEFLAPGRFQGRPVVLYLSEGLCRRWHLGGKDARADLAVGGAIYCYVAGWGGKTPERPGR